MSLDKLLSNIQEYNNLLGFLKERHPEILNEWKKVNAWELPIPKQDATSSEPVTSGVDQKSPVF